MERRNVRSENSQLYCDQLNEIKVHKNHLNDSNSHFSDSASPFETSIEKTLHHAQSQVQCDVTIYRKLRKCLCSFFFIIIWYVWHALACSSNSSYEKSLRWRVFFSFSFLLLHKTRRNIRERRRKNFILRWMLRVCYRAAARWFLCCNKASKQRAVCTRGKSVRTVSKCLPRWMTMMKSKCAIFQGFSLFAPVLSFSAVRA